MAPADVSDEIVALWIAFADIYGHKFVSQFGADPYSGTGQSWATGLADLTMEQLAEGVEACKFAADPWPPTLPQFRARCLGVPTLAAVRLDASTPFARLVWQFLDVYRYRTSPGEAGERLLRDAYELAREHVMRGGALPQESKAITHDEAGAPVVPATVEERMERLDRARKALDQ